MKKLKELMELKDESLKLFIEEYGEKHYISMKEKMLCESKMVGIYKKAEQLLESYQIMAATSDALQLDEEADMGEDILKIESVREIKLLFCRLNAYYNFIEDDSVEWKESYDELESQYTFLKESGIYNYIMDNCGKDMEDLLNMYNVDIYNIKGNETLEAMHKFLALQLEKIDLSKLEELTNGIENIQNLPNYNMIKEISDSIK